MKISSFRGIPELYPNRLKDVKKKKVLEDLDDSNGGKETAEEYHYNLTDDELEGPRELHVSEESEPKVAKDESFHSIPNDRERYSSDLLGLRRQVVPSEVTHHDSSTQQGYDSRTLYQLCQTV